MPIANFGGVNVVTVQKKDIGDAVNMRWFVTTSNTTELNPVDQIDAPMYYTPGTMNFKPTDCFSNPTACFGFEPPLGGKGGYMKMEDCSPVAALNTVDMDSDGLAGCNDPDCWGAPWCTYDASADVTAPKVVSNSVMEFKTSATVKWNADEPSNGSVRFYDTDRTCALGSPNATVASFNNPDIVFDDYKLFHNVLLDTSNVGYALTSNTSYYYKTVNCDNAATPHCSVSACQNFTTRATDKAFKLMIQHDTTISDKTDYTGGFAVFVKTNDTATYSKWNVTGVPSS